MANKMRRDGRLLQNTSSAVAVDTFYDRRSGFEFMTNPLGALLNLAFANEGTTINLDWNTVWHSRSARLRDGWTTE